MSNFFDHRIRESLADENLQLALDANAERRVRIRKEAFASLEDSASMRLQAHAIRAEVIDHLDAYLDQFILKAQANGIIIHQAEDARQAAEIVLKIARQNNAKLIAKSKTMVSEEIHLNHALESNGFQVVETDLGEYIVQLRGEPPSHIITPAVHLTKADVGRLFQEKLNLPYTEEIPVMTTAARQVLRDVFLNADIGISGVNFAVAETGTLCVLTNEGNGRMVTTLPRVHIALLGMERLVPSLDDLALMLRLLPRSATGQKLTVYTSLLHGPRRSDDPDGPEERHVIILDNGRAKLRASPLREMLYCIRCGACLNACPIFREIGGHAYVGKRGNGSPYPGPMGSVLSPALFGQAEFGHLARASSLCGACREACPVDIDLPGLLLRVRAGMTETEEKPRVKDLIPNPPGWLAQGLRLFTWAAERPGRFRLAQKLAGIVAGGKGWLRLPAWSGWGLSKDFPRPAKKSFQEQWKERDPRSRLDVDSVHEPLIKPEQDAALPPLAPESKGKDEPGLDARLKKLQQELEALGARYVHCTPTELSDKVLELLKERGSQEILAWDGGSLLAGFVQDLEKQGIRFMYPTSKDTMQSAQISVGLTGAISAAVETGSLAIPGGPGCPLTASLLPGTHLVLLAKETVLMGVDELLRLPEMTRSAAAVLVSGPSRTADIEMTLTIGVHGPGELIVLCY